MAYWRDTSLGGAAGQRRLFGSGIPLILPSSGTIGNNGALSALTALPLQYLACYMYFPANAIAAGSAAGMYYVVMSSTSAGTIYNNLYTGGVPSIPANPTPFVTVGPGAYIQTTGAPITLFSGIVPAGSMGLDGTLMIDADYSNIGNTNSKTQRIIFGGQTVHQIAQATAANVVAFWRTRITNRGIATRQYVNPTGVVAPTAGSAGVIGNISVNTAADVTVAFTSELATATDFVVLQGFRASIMYS
jgi:hypothetical protein